MPTIPHRFAKLQLDNDPRFFQEGEYLYALNCRLLSNEGNRGGVENVMGNVEIPYDLPTGANKVIGTTQDDSKGRLFYFVWNENSLHRILMYEMQTDSITELWVAEPNNDILKFQEFGLITHARVIDKFLIWTDGINPIRQINIEKALAGAYTTPQFEAQINLAKQPPHFPPAARYQKDDNKTFNYVSGKQFQFAVRYIYQDGEITPISPISDVPIDNSALTAKYSDNNYIAIDFGNDTLSNPLPIKQAGWQNLIKAVQILVRGSDYVVDTNNLNNIQVNRADWKLVTTIEDYVAQSYAYKFYNDGNYQFLSQAEIGKLYEAIPITSGCLEIKDNRVFVANNKEDYDNVPIDIALDIDFNDYGVTVQSTDPNDYDQSQTGDFNNGSPIYQYSYDGGCTIPDNPFCNCFASYVETFNDNSNTPLKFIAQINMTVDLVFTFNVNPSQAIVLTGGSFAYVVIKKNGLQASAAVYFADGQTTPLVVSLLGYNLIQGDIITVEMIITVGAANVINAGQPDEQTTCTSGTATISSNLTTLTADVTSVTSGIIPTTGVLKRGGAYQYALAYFDEQNRYSVVNENGTVDINGTTQTNAKFNLPFLTEDISKYFSNFAPNTFKRGTPIVQWEINHLPPIWATHYAWVRTKNTAYNRFLQWQIQQVLYVTQYKTDANGDLLDSSILAPTPAVNPTTPPPLAQEIYLSIENIQFFKNRFSDSAIGTWIPEPTDRLRLIVRRHTTEPDNAQEPLKFDWQTFYDVPIKAIRGNWLVIDATIVNLPLLRAGDIAEFYTPKLTSEQTIYFEIGETFPILNPHTANRLHSKGFGATAQDQTALLPATGTFHNGDIFYRQRQFVRKEIDLTVINNAQYTKPYPTYVQDPATQTDKLILDTFFVESQDVSDFFYSVADDTGRLAIQNPNNKQITKTTAIRFSNMYLANTNTNGLSNFEGLNEDTMPIENGAITALKIAANSQSEGNIMLAIQEIETTSLYIGNAVLTQQGGGAITAIASQVIATKNTLSGGHGCKHPESVVSYGKNVYWFDENKGNLVRYATNGIFPISNYGTSAFFLKKAKEMRELTKNQKIVIGGFDNGIGEVGEYVISFLHRSSLPNPLPNETLSFSEDDNSYPTFYSFIPECYGRVGVMFFSFKEGKLYRHTRTEDEINSNTVVYNNFYDTQYESQIVGVCFAQPDKDKIYRVFATKSSLSSDQKFWYGYTFKTNLGQETSLIEADYNKGYPFPDTRVESMFIAPLLRDINTPNVTNPILYGDEMRGEILIFYIKTEATSLNILRFAEVGLVLSQGQALV